MNSNEILQIMASSTDGVFAVGADNKIVFWNKSAQKIMGYKPKEVLGKSYKEIIPATDFNGNPVCLKKTGFKKENNNDVNRVHNYEIITHSIKANRIWLSISVFYVPEGLDKYGMSVYIFRDITRQKIYEKIIKEVISKTDIADQLKITIPSIKKDNNISPPNRLTTREREVLLLLADGYSTKFISSNLYIALSTLRKHIRNIYSKLQAHSMLDAVAKARQNNLI